MRLLVLLLLAATASAQPASVMGKSLPSPDLAAGTVTVRVIDGSAAKPHANVVVTLTGDKTKRTATTDAAGRATFDHVTAGATITATVTSSKEPLATSEPFVMPSDGGVRVMLSMAPMAAVQARLTSGMAEANDDLGSGVLRVRLSYNNLGDPKPPNGVTVTLVAYAADDSVKVLTGKTDYTGNASFDHLDTSGATAYFAMAQLPRKGRVDRLLSKPIVLDARGARVTLSAAARDSVDPALDDVITVDNRQPVGTKKGAIRIAIEGAAEPKLPVRVVDAATGKVIATGAATKELVLVAAKPGQVVYVDTTLHDKTYRSLPAEIVADRGAELSLFIAPRVQMQFEMRIKAYDDAIRVHARFAIDNTSWIPYRAGELVVPLPKGAVEITTDTGTVRGASIVVPGALPPSGTLITVELDVPAVNRNVDLSLDLPFGTTKSALMLEMERGVSIDVPNAKSVTSELDHREWIAAPDLSSPPNQALTAKIQVPLPAKDAAAQHACRDLDPDPNPLIGKKLPDAELAGTDGKKAKVSSFHPTVVNMTATWNSVSVPEQQALARLTSQASVVVVMSDSDPKPVIKLFGRKPPFHVLLDPPPTPDENIGVTTLAWGTHLLPESFLLDRDGVVRMYFANVRDWDAPKLRGCVKALQ